METWFGCHGKFDRSPAAQERGRWIRCRIVTCLAVNVSEGPERKRICHTKREDFHWHRPLRVPQKRHTWRLQLCLFSLLLFSGKVYLERSEVAAGRRTSHATIGGIDLCQHCISTVQCPKWKALRCTLELRRMMSITCHLYWCPITSPRRRAQLYASLQKFKHSS